MKAEYRRDLQNNYLILEASDDLEAEDFRLRMAEQNEIPGLLPMHSARMNGILYFHYEITSRQPLAALYEKRTMGCEDILFLFRAICDVLEALQRFLLDPAQLIFDPEFLYVDPEQHKVQFCYFPSEEAVSPVSVLAEFILKRLDHRDQGAVAAGYGFYQKAAEGNGSLHRILQGMLEMCCGGDREAGAADMDAVLGRAPGPGTGPESGAREKRLQEAESGEDEWESTGQGRRSRDRGRESRRQGQGDRGHAPGSRGQKRGDREQEREEPWADEWQEPCPVTHFERRSRERTEKREERKREDRKQRLPGRVDRLFALIHPAVLISGLFFLVVLELIFYLEFLTVTEAGGIFFLLISVEILANRFLRSSREKKKESRLADEEEDEEMYRLLQEEMYDFREPAAEIAKTQCLTPGEEQYGLRLVCIRGGSAGGSGPDIVAGPDPVCIGKIKGESDVILDSPTVSRRHARLECRDGVCYIRDLNSRNGTFLNGRRLNPREHCQVRQGDTVAFAEIEYRAVSQ